MEERGNEQPNDCALYFLNLFCEHITRGRPCTLQFFLSFSKDRILIIPNAKFISIHNLFGLNSFQTNLWRKGDALNLPPHPGCNRHQQDSCIFRIGNPKKILATSHASILPLWVAAPLPRLGSALCLDLLDSCPPRVWVFHLLSSVQVCENGGSNGLRSTACYQRLPIGPMDVLTRVVQAFSIMNFWQFLQRFAKGNHW